MEDSGVQEDSILRWKVYEHQIRIGNEAMRTSQLGLLIDPKGDSSVSKVVPQLPCWTEALQWSKVIHKQILRKI
jgi:hypothetical protein